MGNIREYRTRYNKNIPFQFRGTIVGVEIIAKVNNDIRFAAFQPHERSQWTTVKAYRVEDGTPLYKEEFPTLSIREYMDLLYDFIEDFKIKINE